MKPESINMLRHVEKALRSEETALTHYLADDIATVIASENGEDDLTPREVAEIKEGNWLEVIKMVRARTHCALQEAKDLVKKVGERLGRFDPNATGAQRWKVP